MNALISFFMKCIVNIGLAIFFGLLSGCHTANEKSPLPRVDTARAHTIDTSAETVLLQHSADTAVSNADSVFSNKIFNRCDPNCTWHYHYPFTDSSYIFAIQHCPEEYIENGENATIYFGKDNGASDKIFWQEHLFMATEKDNYRLEDFNGDGVKDILLFTNTGGRGGNAFYRLFLVDARKHTLTSVANFNDVVNPSYNKKYGIITSYGMSGRNYYGIYKLAKDNKIHKIGEDFEDTFDDQEELDQKIEAVLKERR